VLARNPAVLVRSPQAARAEAVRVLRRQRRRPRRGWLSRSRGPTQCAGVSAARPAPGKKPPDADHRRQH
ncbi:MAG: hypothetical protein ACRDR6_29855, partial [Pseudonocardiaceae bacterium]